MTRLYLLLNFVGRFTSYEALLGLAFGFIAGAILGALSLSLAAVLYLAILFGVAGVVSGILIGGINGIVLTVVTIALASRINKFNMLALITSVIVAFIVGWNWFLIVLKSYSVTGQVNLWVILVPVFAVTAAAAYASQRVSAWYVLNTAEQEPRS